MGSGFSITDENILNIGGRLEKLLLNSCMIQELNLFVSLIQSTGWRSSATNFSVSQRRN